MTILCGTEYGFPYGSYFGPCDDIDTTEQARGRARQRMLDDTLGFDALVRTLGFGLEEPEHDAWLLLHYISVGTAVGTSLDMHGEDLGLPRLSLLWDDNRYRRILGAWIVPQVGKRTIPALLTMLEALADGEVYSVREYLPGTVRIEVAPIDADTMSIWAQVLDAARPRGVRFWAAFTESDVPFVLDESLLDGPDVLVGIVEI
jgi:hypothetical protein